MQKDLFFSSVYNSNTRFSKQEVPGTISTRFDIEAQGDIEKGIDLNEQLVHNKAATFYMRVNSSSMINAGIAAGDIVIVDRSIDPTNGMVVIVAIDGAMLIRRLEITFNSIRLVPETPKLATINVSTFSNFKIWGVVIYLIRNI
jgi:DNA polymerase V